jgi:hypothetical protein
MTTPFVSRIALAGATALTFLTACGGGSGSADGATTTVAVADSGTVSTTSQPPAATDPPAAQPPATDPPATDPPAAEPPATDPPATDPPDSGGNDGCPVGTWLITTEALQAFYDTVNASSGTDFSFVGQVLFTLGADGTFVYAMQDFVLTSSIGGPVTSVTLVGEVSGNYEVVDARFHTTIVNPDVTATVVSDGVVVDGTMILEQFLTEFPVNNATFACVGDDLIVDFPVVGSSASVVMVPA